jgi:hypothetical protein
LIGSAISGLLASIGRGAVALSRAIGRAVRGLGALLLTAERQITPRRATLAVAGSGVLVLAVSQFLDFRAIEIGSGYSAVQEIARAPRIEVQTPMDAHSILLLAAAALAAGCLAALVLGGRRIFAIGLSLAGIATIAVTMLVDLPRGLDTEEATIAFTGVAAVLLTGFWLQLAAGVVLTATGLLLAATGTGRERSANRGRLRDGRGDREPDPINGPDRADGSGRAEGPGRTDDPRRTDGPGRVRERPA